MSVNLASYFNSKTPGKDKAFVEINSWNDNDINCCNYSFGYKIKLKGKKLLVKQTCKPSQMHLLSNRGERFLADWLQFSPATIVQIDSRIGLDKLDMWANQCKKCGKAVFLRLSQNKKLYQSFNYLNRINWFIKRCLDFLGALILVIILAPVFIALALLIYVYFQEPILQTQCCVGKQGKLFYLYKFGGKLEKINLHVLSKLPQLFNIVKGDMSFVGRFPWSLAEAIKIQPSEQYYLSILPGITGAWQIQNNR